MKKLLLLLFMFASFQIFGQLSENFESATFPPTGWATFTNGIGTTENWGIENTTPAYIYQGAQSAYVNPEDVLDGTFAEDWLVSPAVTVPANGILKFYTRKFVPNVYFGSNYSLKISTTSQTSIPTFTDVQTWTEGQLFGSFTNYREIEVNLSAYAGQTLYFAFVLNNDDGEGWLIDNININSACGVPTSPIVSSVTPTTATLSWTGPAGVSQWEVELIPSLANYVGAGVIVNTNNYVYPGLSPNTTYKYRVRAICPSGISGNWSTSFIFETPSFGDTCAGPIVISTLPYQTVDNTSNYADTNDIAQPPLCSNTVANYMAGNDVFYSFTPSFTGNIAVNLAPTAINSSIHIYSACPGTAGVTCLGGVADNTSVPRNINPFPVVAGTTYYIIISSSAASQTVGYTLTIQRVFCTQPSGLTATNITTSSADLSWAASAGTTSWQYTFGPAPYGLPTASSVINTTSSNSSNVAPGIAGVVYQYYVRADCNDGNFSIWSGPFTYTLPQVATPLNFIDGFETLTGWTLNSLNQTNKWAIGTGINNGGTHALYVTDTNGATNTYNNITTSVVHAYKDFIIPAGATQLDLTFDWRSVGDAQDYIRVWTAPTTFNPITGTQINAVPNSVVKWGNDLTSVSAFTTQNYTLNATPYAGSTMRLIYEWRNNNTAGLQPPAAIDNVKLNLVTCPKPGNLVISGIGYNTAQVAWTNGGTETQWEILVLPAGAPAPTATSSGIVTSSGSPFVITGLTSVTCYDVYVRAKCGPTENSFWSVKANFCTTPNYCAGDHFYDTGGASGNYSNNQAITSIICPGNAGDVVTVVFNSFNVATGDNLVIRDGNLPTSPIVGTYSGTTLPPSFSATSASGCLTFVFTSNGTTVSAGWDATIYCTPPITCFKPVVLTATNIGATTAQLSWTESGTATQWEYLVLPLGANIPILGQSGVPAPSNPFVVGGLSPSTTYTFYVRAICSASNASFWSDGFTFSTTPVNDECNNALQASVNTSLSCDITTSVDFKGATASTSTGTCTPNVSDIWYKFTAISTTHSIQTEGTNAVMASVNLALYSGSCSSLNVLQCGTSTDVNGPTVVGNTIEGHVANGLTIGQTYYIRLTTTLNTATSIPLKLCIGSISCTGADPVCAGVGYTNSTDVIDFGQYGTEVLSTPNPKFFFIKANFTGNLNCTISQTSGDVDYLMWGPYATKDIACNNVPNQNPISDSYSISAVETFTVPIVSGQYYILMVTNFVNDPGTISIVTNLTTPICINADFRYANPAYCNNATPALPTYFNGGQAGVFSSTPAGLALNPSTGEINFVGSSPGVYLVSNKVSPTSDPLDDIIETVQVIVTPTPNATIAYNNATYCKSNANSQAITISGNSGTGAYYSSSPAGLQNALDPVTGSIIPVLANVGVYTVTLTVPAQGGCAQYTTTTQVEIIPSPVIPAQVDVNACNSYVLPALTVGNYFTATGGTGTPLSAGTVISTDQTIYVYATNGQCASEDPFNVKIVSIPTPTFDYVTQPTCAVQTGSITITAPVASGGTAPSGLFISEVTDANTGSLSYVELYNGTGAAVNLATYKLRVFTTGGGLPYTTACDNALSGTIANNATFIIKLSNNASIPGVTHDLQLPLCAGVNNNDNIKLTTSANVVIDNWGTTDGSTFTPSGLPGYTYRRLASATPLPSTVWNPADWNAIDPENYSNLGQYTLNTSNYEYSVDNGTYQTNTTFTGIAPGNHSFVVHDLINNCYSAPVSFIINAVPYTNPVTDFSYTTPICIASTNPSPALAAGFTSGGTFSYVGTGLDLNSTNGTINLATSTPGTYVVTYTYAADLANCINLGSSSANIVILAVPVAADLPDVSQCDSFQLPVLPAGNNYYTAAGGSGTLLNAGSAVTTSQTIFVYAQTGTTPNCTDEESFAVSIQQKETPIFDPISDLCVGDGNITLPTTSNNGVDGTWSPAIVDTSVESSIVYSFIPASSECANPTTMTVNVEFCDIQKGISPNGDGLNDYLKLVANKVEIFNRYGKEVYTKTNYNNDWHGQFMGGGDMPDGTYYYVIELVSGTKKTGWIYINREQ